MTCIIVLNKHDGGNIASETVFKQNWYFGLSQNGLKGIQGILDIVSLNLVLHAYIDIIQFTLNIDIRIIYTQIYTVWYGFNA